MTGRLEGKSAFVTGAGAGIGRAIALAMSSEGATVGAADIDGAAASSCVAEIEAAGGSARAFACDISDRLAVDATVTSFIAESRNVVGSAIGQPRGSRRRHISIKHSPWEQRSAGPSARLHDRRTGYC